MGVATTAGWERLCATLPWGRLTRWATALGLAVPDRPADQALLEDVILPYFAAREDVQRVLFIGMDRTTRHYWRLFRGREYWSIDIDPRKQKYAGRLHITDSAEHLDAYFRPGHFDLIVCRDLRGFRRGGHTAYENTFAGCWSRLRPGGWLVVGEGGATGRRRFPSDATRSTARFDRAEIPRLAAARHSGSGLGFRFFVRPPASGDGPVRSRVRG